PDEVEDVEFERSPFGFEARADEVRQREHEENPDEARRRRDEEIGEKAPDLAVFHGVEIERELQDELGAHHEEQEDDAHPSDDPEYEPFDRKPSDRALEAGEEPVHRA